MEDINLFSWLYEDGWYLTIRLYLTGSFYFRACEQIKGIQKENEIIRQEVMRKVIRDIRKRIIDRLEREIISNVTS